jgi:hypothetical protein
VRIEATATATEGSQITITVHVTHSGNNFFHFTDWVWLKANDTEMGRWESSNPTVVRRRKTSPARYPTVFKTP